MWPETPIQAIAFLVACFALGCSLTWSAIYVWRLQGRHQRRQQRLIPAATILADLEARDTWAEDDQGLGATPAHRAAIAKLRADVRQGTLKPWEYEAELDAILDEAWVGEAPQDTGVPTLTHLAAISRQKQSAAGGYLKPPASWMKDDPRKGVGLTGERR